ncbi:hypothetical protein FA09DRAFT_327931 [Tilletiopsis washingtonensis]|uniref:Uncharacterized protein n=1 Tax=Tilletiopsis washingtonensis TaxID=58919 RepID=A0A316ZG68_9BASI|nr:hypothetical protein FA09DRAFT_327931 [Tilletiopsis washingtonensis]PWO00502.1 hypothetical protein FA09DRAFT_327931 [Tilletiopsis washingtonensis]
MSTDSKVQAHITGAEGKLPADDVGKHHHDERPAHEQGKENSHAALDAKDEKSIANKLDAAAKADKAEKQAENEPGPRPTDAAAANGNEPSKGAKIDEQIELEEEAEIARKDAAKAQAKANK